METDIDCAGCGLPLNSGDLPKACKMPLCGKCRPFKRALPDPEGDMQCSECHRRINSDDLRIIAVCACCCWGVKVPK